MTPEYIGYSGKLVSRFFCSRLFSTLVFTIQRPAGGSLV